MVKVEQVSSCQRKVVVAGDKRLQRRCRNLLMVLGTLLSTVGAQQNPFGVPEILKDNVAFWKEIYRDVSLKEGLLHDREYPRIVLEKISVAGKSPAQQSLLIDERKKELGAMLLRIRQQPDSLLTPREKEIKQLYRSSGSPTALEGAEERIRFQLGQKERYRQGLERSYLYLDTIAAILRAHGVPEQLKYLPHVESSFDAAAYSKVGAAGMWQFMRSTGKMYMRVDYSIDERLDPVRSSIAAARLLRHNYQQLKSWPLAITAYNHGVNGMRRAVEATGSNDIEVILRKHESQSFKFASKNFYACFLAASQLADSAQILFPGLKKQLPPPLKTIVLESATRPATLARRLGLSEEALKQCNPSLRPVVFTQQKALPAGFTVNFPASHTPPVQPATAVANNQKSSPVEPPAELTQYYKIVRGDNLQAISRRLGVSLAQLMQLNDIKRSDRIYAGQVLRLPAKVSSPQTVAQRAIKPPAKPAPAVQLKPAVAAAPPAPVVAQADAVEDEVESDEEDDDGDDEEESGLGVQNQAQVPHTNDTLPAMEPLVFVDARPAVPPKSGLAATTRYNTTFNAEIYTLGIELLAGGGLAKITVALNETIGHYAEWMKVATRSIRRLNNVKSNSIRIGSTLQLPIGSSSDMRSFEVNRLEYHMAIEEDFYARFEVVSSAPHTIRSGETIWGLCKREQLPMWLVKKHNPDKELFALKQGTVLSIPKIAARTAHTPPALIDSQTDSLPIPSTDDNSQ